MDKNIKLADEKIKEALSDEQALHDYYMRDLAKMEYISDMKTSKQKGIEKGIEKGKKEGKKEGKREKELEIAIKLKNKGIAFELIAETTNIPISKIKKL